MSSYFLITFSTSVLRGLQQRGLVDLAPNSTEETATFIANRLTGAQHKSLISAFTAALLASPNCEELYATDEDLLEIVGDLDPNTAGIRRG